MAQRDQVTEAFELFDSSGKGQLQVSEAASAIRALGHILTDTDIRNCLKQVGVDARGQVTLQQFKKIHGSLPAQDYARQLEDAFKTVDKEGSGFVMASELRHLLTNMGDKLSDEDFAILLEELDIDSNGRVQFKDFVRLLKSK